jgi:hypothetical protein
MSGIIYFTSGKTLEINEFEYTQIAPKLQNGGIRLYKVRGKGFVPLNSATMEFVEHVPEPVVVKKGTSVGPSDLAEKIVATPSKTQAEEDANDEAWAETQPHKQYDHKEEPKTLQERKDEAMSDLMAKSNCSHEPEKMNLYVQHTAKGVRYFPVCSFCGKRERYVSESKILKGEYAGTPNEKWTEADIETAQAWVED